MIGDNAKKMMMEDATTGLYCSSAFLSLSLEKLKTSDFDGSNPLVKRTRYLWHIQYSPYTKQGDLRKCPYRVVCDLFNGNVIRVSGYKDLMNYAKERLDVARYVQWSDVSRESFDLAKENLGMQIPTLFNFKAYLEDYRAANHCKNVCLNPVKADYEVYQE